MEVYWASLGGTDAQTSQVEDLAGVQEPLLQIAQVRKMKFFGLVTRHLSELRLGTSSCMEESLQTGGIVGHGEVG